MKYLLCSYATKVRHVYDTKVAQVSDLSVTTHWLEYDDETNTICVTTDPLPKEAYGEMSLAVQFEIGRHVLERCEVIKTIARPYREGKPLPWEAFFPGVLSFYLAEVQDLVPATEHKQLETIFIQAKLEAFLWCEENGGTLFA